MNKIKYDILNHLFRYSYYNQRNISKVTGYSVGKVNQTLCQLIEDGYLTEEYVLTEKALVEKNEKKPRNAIIMAAGFGMRMIPINREMPKGLLEVQGEPLIERIIRQLHEAEIFDITVIVGFMKESYEYLIDQYDVKLVVNREYAEKNNLHSLALMANQIGNTYIIPCDIWCEKNPFSKEEWYSWYMVTDMMDDESDVRVNRKLELVEVEPGKGGNAMIGISYILQEDAQWLGPRLLQMDQKKSYQGSFWEAALMEKGKMRLWANVKHSAQVCEINTYEQLREMDSHSPNLNSQILQLIGGALGCHMDDIVDIQVLKKGMTNRSFLFQVADKTYIMRIPGEGTDALINRKEEAKVYQTIQSLGLSDTIRYFNPENGYKLTEYISGTHCCDPDNWEEIRSCMKVLRQFHQANLQVDHVFDVFERIEFYEKLWNGESSCYRDYQETKKKVYELKEYMDTQPKHWSLSHIDSIPDNFLLNTDENGEEHIHLIDWEYAGMQDTDVDIAMFGIYAMYDRQKMDRLIDSYYTEGCPKEKRMKIYCYVAACGLLWSNWCEFKRHQGVEFGEYSLKQYRYAKEYYRYVKEEL